METRRLGRLGHSSSVLIYGAAALASVEQADADRSIQQALDAGINHFDVAASYGDAELRLGPWMAEIRDRIFLATKTGQRSREDAYRELNASLERLRVDRLDLIQLHAVGSLDELDLVTGTGGALEAAIQARDEGLVSAIGITGHGHQAPATHLEALRRFPFETVITPLNHRLAQDEAYAADFAALAAEVRRQDAGLMAIKALARRPWKAGEQNYETWYQPFDDQERIDAAVAWALSHDEITGIPTAGDTLLLPKMIKAEATAPRMSRAEAARILGGVSDYSSPFVGAWA
jgi:aryl-alcohol dehydrogenase-like predicted oxidoreductase